ncbi:hypothetical protein GJ496_002753 [Pomphorhynchus laevis]|nr:hypothetical protein GJ496_002753 [Pomphorhynchus laevis]
MRRCHRISVEEEDRCLEIYDNADAKSPKEREVKPIPRMFAVTSMPIRSYVVITEEMIATDFLPLFPEITMKDDLQKLTERMISATASEKRILGSINTKVSYKIFYMSIDFQKWNSNMRDDLVHDCFLFMNQLYGALSEIKQMHDVVIKPSDKGGEAFVWSRSLYIAEAMRHLSQNAHKTATIDDLELATTAVRELLEKHASLRAVDADSRRCASKDIIKSVYDVEDYVYVKPSNGKCTTRWNKGVITALISEQTAEVHAIPRHVTDICPCNQVNKNEALNMNRSEYSTSSDDEQMIHDTYNSEDDSLDIYPKRKFLQYKKQRKE